ncbi:hypothetical protein SO694_00030038 [Aureococcus anophagefferens]|uniref:RING-type domain-containing protein n=1 Tax=Aureococcus anophagefferens TaxID=44056 RepID=A0ABR1FJU6_AURAN
MVALWREVETGARYAQTTAMDKYPKLNTKSFKGLSSEIAKKPQTGNQGARDVKTYLAADVDALVARHAAPEPETVDPRWREVEAGTRHTEKTAMERYPHLTFRSFQDLPSKIATKPKGSSGGARDVKTYLAADVDDLVARLAAREPEPVDPRWREVETGARYTATTAMKRYPQLNWHCFADLPFEIARQPKISKSQPRDVEAGRRYDRKTAMKRYPQLNWHCFADLPFEIARQPKISKSQPRDVKTYLAADIDALVARLAAAEPEPVHPLWLEVEAGRRYDRKTAMKRYPQLTDYFFRDLPFEIARRPMIGKATACDIKTYAAADVEALAAARANKRARVQEPEPPQEPEPEEEEPEECPVCLDPMTGATATLVCGHLFCKDCITDWASSQTTCPTCRETLQFAP